MRHSTGLEPATTLTGSPICPSCVGVGTTMTTEQFIAALFADVPEKLWIYLWELKPWDGKTCDQNGKPKRIGVTHWFQPTAIPEMANKAIQLDRASDVYFGCAIAPTRGAPNTRCEAAKAAGIPGLWLDVDFGAAGHKKKNLPPTQADAESLIVSLGIEPSIVVFSGHGLQPWWLFKEPWIFDNEAERAKGAALAENWSKLLRSKAKHRGWDQDGVGDLARVLRVPGTTNKKEQQPIPTYVIGDGNGRSR